MDRSLDSELVQKIIDQLAVVRQKISDAGIDPDGVTILGVTKTQPLSVVSAALEAGLKDFGENYAQELELKFKELSLSEALATKIKKPHWHFIGGLQRNKIKRIASAVTLWHSIDRVELIDELAKRSAGAQMLLQVNTSAEVQKSGCAPADVSTLVERAQTLGLKVEGLMTLGPTNRSPESSFDMLRQLGEQNQLKELSMGMSGDYEVAVAHGASIIRLGSILFGERGKANQ